MRRLAFKLGIQDLPDLFELVAAVTVIAFVIWLGVAVVTDSGPFADHPHERGHLAPTPKKAQDQFDAHRVSPQQ